MDIDPCGAMKTSVVWLLTYNVWMKVKSVSSPRGIPRKKERVQQTRTADYF